MLRSKSILSVVHLTWRKQTQYHETIQQAIKTASVRGSLAQAQVTKANSDYHGMAATIEMIHACLQVMRLELLEGNGA